MNDSTAWTDVWSARYGHVCPETPGSIVTIEGVADKDTYNPALYETPGYKVLAFRAEQRASSTENPSQYHPAILFATQAGGDRWFSGGAVPPFDMLEDPFFFYFIEGGRRRVAFGGVRIEFTPGGPVAATELYSGDTLGSLDRDPFLIIEDMKDVRFRQLPDGRFLVCRRPRGGEYGEGRITIHIIERLEDVNNPILTGKPLAVLDSGTDISDWVGVNNIYLIQGPTGEAWVGLLGHVALRDPQGNKHYAASTYRISLQQLLDSDVHAVRPHIIATRACFPPGAAKTPQDVDVLFPGHLEQLDSYRYYLWTGLSDTAIGRIEVFDPFQLHP